jgi:hypothetical protein
MPNFAQEALWFPTSCRTLRMVVVELSIDEKEVDLAARRLNPD